MKIIIERRDTKYYLFSAPEGTEISIRDFDFGDHIFGLVTEGAMTEEDAGAVVEFDDWGDPYVEVDVEPSYEPYRGGA